MNDFLRVLSLKIDPGDSNINNGKLLKFVSDGSIYTLSISASIHMTRDIAGQNATITIYNLSRSTSADLMRMIKSKSNTVQINAGYIADSLIYESLDYTGKGLSYDEYSNLIYPLDRLPVIFIGTIKTVNLKKTGENIATEIICATLNYNMAKSRVNFQFSSGTTLSNVISKIASTLPVGSIDESWMSNSLFSRKLSRSFSVNEPTVDALNSLSKIYGFTWWVDKNKFICKADDDMQQPPRSGIRTLSPKTGLIYATPKLVNGTATAQSIQISHMFTTEVFPGDWVYIESKYLTDWLGVIDLYGMNNKYGPYLIATVDAELDTKSDSWESEMVVFTQTDNTVKVPFTLPIQI